MSNRLELRYKISLKALINLELVVKNMKEIDKFKNIIEGTQEEKLNILTDSLIQRFEYCFDITWKYLKEYVINVLKLPLDVKTPAMVFRTLLKAEFFTEEQMNIALKTGLTQRSQIVD
jgi:hypothetical protein